MLSLLWVGGLLRHRRARLAGAAAGVALAVGLLGSIGAFLAGARRDMTRHAIAGVAVDWQVEAQPGANPASVTAALRSLPEVTAALPVGFAASTGLQATVGGTTQNTAAGLVLGLPAGYAAAFPGELRPLTGAAQGVLLAQQTAANLDAGPGDAISIGRAGLPAVQVRVDGVVDLPQADSLFQKVGAPSGSQPQAPPDNVVLLDEAVWHQAFDPLAASRPDLVRNQAHVRLRHDLPADPARAFTVVTARARHLEASLAGSALVGDNLAATLDAARSDALYAQVLFILLGLPGAALAGVLTAVVVGAGAGRRRQEFGLLRARGARVGQVVRLAAAEAGAVALAGGAVGLGIAAGVGAAAFGSATFGTTALAAALWALAAAAAGALIALATVALPAWRDARAATVASAGAVVGRRRAPAWKRAGLDLWLLGGAGVVFWLTSRAGYNVVLVPEGVPTVSVSYWALAGPLLAWAGLGLMAWRLADVILLRGRTAVGRLVRPVAGSLAGVISASLARQRRLLATASAILGLALAFAISTSVFDATYRQQVRVDALLTNGADVTVGEPAGSGAGAATLRRIAATPGTGHVEPLLHRFAYVGSDLQDLFGVRPATVGSATALQDSYFVGGSARTLLGRLAGRPDGVLVSAETARDFQLQPGDPVRLRLRDARTGALREVRFHYQGVVKEFPTAPRDSFLVANADYVAAQSGDASIDTFLVSTHASPPRLAARLRQALGVGPTITDLSASRAAAGSSLTAVDLAGLSRVELGFAAVLAMAAAGLVLALGMAERRRSFAIASALGARRRQVAAFTRSEAGMVSLIGFGCGAVAAWALAVLVVKVLTGVFDPPPSHLAVPWLYLSLVGALTLAAVAAGAELTVQAAGSGTVETLRDL